MRRRIRLMCDYNQVTCPSIIACPLGWLQRSIARVIDLEGVAQQAQLHQVHRVRVYQITPRTILQIALIALLLWQVGRELPTSRAAYQS